MDASRLYVQDSVLRQLSPASVNPEQFSKLVRDSIDRLHKKSPTYTGDDASSLIASRMVEQVLAEVIRTEFQPRYSSRYMDIVQGGIRPFSKTYIQKKITRQGIADYVTSADMPVVNANMEEIHKKIYTIGDKMEWSWFEMQEAMAGGAPLDIELGLAAREAALDAREIILISGDSGLPKGGGNIPTGFINDATVPTTSVVGVWSGKTADQIIADVQAILGTYRANTARRYEPDTMLLPEAQIAQIELLRVGDTGMTVKQYLIANIASLQNIDVLPQLLAAGAAGADRGMMYAKNKMVVRGVVPLEFQFISPQDKDLMFTAFGVERIAGCEFRQPFGALYFDGI